MRTPLAALVAVALLVVSALPAAAQGDDEAQADLQARVDEFVGLVNGGVAAITIRDGVVTSAQAGIANREGDPFTVDTPVLVDSAAAAMTYAVALGLVDEGTLDLDAPVTDYLPDAPVADGATVRQLLESRAGIPPVWPTVADSFSEDPDRTWTTDDMVALADPAEAGTAGEFSPGYVGTLVTIQLIEVLTGQDFATVFDERIVQPLGLGGTVHAEGDFARPENAAAGWRFGNGPTEVAYVTDDWEAMRTSRPTYSTAADLTTFHRAVVDGQLVSPKLVAETMYDDEIETMGYGFYRTNAIFPAAGPLGASYFGIDGWGPSGSSATVAVDPSSGDLLVVLSNTWALDTLVLATDIVRSWAPELAAGTTFTEARMQIRWVQGTYTCDIGQQSPFDLPPCESDEVTARYTYSLPYELTGTFEGSGVQNGVWLQNQQDGTFTYAADGVFMGEVEGCGYGTMYYRIEDGAGYFGEEELTYTQGTARILPGGTLPLAGSIDQTGVQSSHFDGTATMDLTGAYYCEGADA